MTHTTVKYLNVMCEIVEVKVSMVFPDMTMEAAFVKERGTTELTTHPIEIPSTATGHSWGRQ